MYSGPNIHYNYSYSYNYNHQPSHYNRSQYQRPPYRGTSGQYTQSSKTTPSGEPYYRSASADYYRYPSSYRGSRGYANPSTNYSSTYNSRSGSRQNLLDYQSSSRQNLLDYPQNTSSSRSLPIDNLQKYSADYPLDRYSSKDYYASKFSKDYITNPYYSSSLYPTKSYSTDVYYNTKYKPEYSAADRYTTANYYRQYPTDYSRNYFANQNNPRYNSGGYGDDYSPNYSSSYPQLNPYSSSYYPQEYSREYSRSYPQLDYYPSEYSSQSRNYSRDYSPKYTRDYSPQYTRDYSPKYSGYSRDSTRDYSRNYTRDYYRDYPPDYSANYSSRKYRPNYSTEYPQSSYYRSAGYSGNIQQQYPYTRCQSAPLLPYTSEYSRDYGKDYRYSDSYNRPSGYLSYSQQYPYNRCQSAPPYQYPSTSYQYNPQRLTNTKYNQSTTSNPNITKPKSIMRSSRGSSSYGYENPYGYSNPGAQSYSAYNNSSGYDRDGYDRGGNRYGSSASAQHNHPPYYGAASGQSSGYHSGGQPLHHSSYDQYGGGSDPSGYRHQNGYPGAAHHQQSSHISASSGYGSQSHQANLDPHYHTTTSVYQQQSQPPPPASSSYPYQQNQPQSQSSYHQMGGPMAQTSLATNPYTSGGAPGVASSVPPNSLALKNTAASMPAKNPFGPGGPYGLDSSNLDYYRKLYYPYDPITGEYMKDATPPTDTANASVGGLRPGDIAGMTEQQRQLYLRTQNAAGGAGAGGAGGAHSHLNSNYGAIGGGGMGAASGGVFGDGPQSGGPMGMVSGQYNQYGPGQYDQEQDSLLLCCDFLIPRPSITCLIITLFAMLVLIIIFTVVKFTIIYPADASNAETLALVDQIVVLLLFAALIALIWIFGIYFTSRRTRRQISNLLSCASGGPGLEHTLVQDYDGYVYANSATNTPAHTAGTHNHTHSHQSRVNATGVSGSAANARYTGNNVNYRYANNFV